MEFLFCLGKYCCESGCCDISKELQGKGYVPALPPASTLNVNASMTETKPMNSVCFGTQCGPHCLPIVHGSTCCSNPMFACPPNTKCCSNSSFEHPWCCKMSQSCSTIKNICINNNNCHGTQCGSVCLSFVFNGTCCSGQRGVCPPLQRCCSNPYVERTWCCKLSEHCSTESKECITSSAACNGTLCGWYCHPGIYSATCCNDPKFTCPLNSKCCGNSYSEQPWCCKRYEQCSSITNQCISGAITTSAEIMTLLFAFTIGIVIKHFL